MAASDPATLLLALLRLLAAGIYLTVAAVLYNRPVEPAQHGAMRSFALWWAGIGLVMLVTVPLALGARFETLGLLAWRLGVYTIYVVLIAAIAGLLYYLLYLYTGRPQMRWVAVAYLMFMLAFLVLQLEGAAPRSRVVEGEIEVWFQRGAPPWASPWFMALLAVPPLAAALAYAALWFRVPEPLARYRIALVSSAFVLWFAYIAVTRIAGLNSGVPGPVDLAAVLDQAVGLVAAFVVALAYLPPVAIHRRLGGSP